MSQKCYVMIITKELFIAGEFRGFSRNL